MRRDDGTPLILGVAALLAALPYGLRGSRAMVDEGLVDGYWGSQGAGALITTGERCLLLKRSWDVLDPGLWGVPGGAVPVDDETGEAADLLETAMQEAQEEAELDLRGVGNVTGKTVFVAPNGRFRYTTFVLRVPSAWASRAKPRLNWESSDWGWFSAQEVERLREEGALHPGVSFTMDRARVFDR
jgi:8-oxo-dGTP pyrophosphatase MutT (NUDIX family)